MLSQTAQQFVSSDGQLEVDLPANSLDTAQLAQSSSGISRIITQVQPGSGGLRSEHIFFGTYKFQFFDGTGKPLSGVHLLHPLTLHYHLRPEQQTLLWQGQEITALWTQVQGAASMPAIPISMRGQTTGIAPVQPTGVVPLPATTLAPTLLHGKSDTSGRDWSFQSTLSAPTTTGTQPTGSVTQAAGQAVQASSVTFNTQAPQASWGTPTDFQVGLSSGGLNFTYPLSLPPGPGGLVPNLALNYSSGSVDENHNLQAAAPWTGQGWSLDLGSVSWAQENVTPGGTNALEQVWHISDPSGIGGQLIPPDQHFSTTGANLNPTPSQLSSGVYIWHTAPESHAKVQEINFNNAPCWRVWLPSGIMEEFGCTNPSRESYPDGSGHWNTYNWKLDLMTDRFGNQVHISYQTIQPSGQAVRDAAISDITYDDPGCHNSTTACSTWNPLIDIHFDANQTVARLLNSGCGSGTPGQTRCDDPIDVSGGLPAPKVMSAYVLNDVQIKVNGNLLHEYDFSYNQGGHTNPILDPATGQNEVFAGYLTLGKIEEKGTNGTSLNAPVINVTYVQKWQHYSDLFSFATPNTNCSPYPNAPRTGNICYLWSQSWLTYYISNLDNGRGWNESITWQEAHSNTWGVDGGAANDAFNCTSSQTTTNTCGRADDKTWSHVVVASRTATSNGVSSTWSYKYFLQTGVGATYPGVNPTYTCNPCSQTYDWGNQNDNDFADYYNGDFQSFQIVQVTQPDTSFQIHTYGATTGWGLANSSIACALTKPCSVARYGGDGGCPLATVFAGREQQEEDYDSQSHLLKRLNWSWSSNCPPPGVPGSANAGGGSIDPGSGFLFSELDHNNPVMVCDPRVNTQDTYLTDGVTNNVSDPRVVHTTSATTYDGSSANSGSNCGTFQGGYDYGNVSVQDTTANDVGGQHIKQLATFCINDNVGSGIFLTDLVGQTFTQDASNVLYGCHANFYGGGGFLTTPSLPDLTRHEEHTPYTGGCTAPGSLVATLHGYDASGVPITNTDGDNHLGCTSGSTQFSACATYDNLDTHLLTATNAKNQSTTYSYDTLQETPEAGFGQWLMSTTDVNGQTTTYQYDALGRLTAIINPGDSVTSPSVTYTYTNTCSAGKTTPCLELDTSTRFTAGGPTTTTMKQWYDGWGRLVETQTPGPNLFSHVPAIPSLLVTYTVYDNMGRATTKSLQYAVAATAGLGYVAPDLNQPRTATAYDSLGRSLGVVTYSNTSTIVTKSSISYTVAQGVPTLSSENSNAYEQTITLDAYNHQAISYTDGLGRTRFSQVDSGTGSPYSVVRTMGKTYDVVGNTLAVTTYDSAGTAKAGYSATYDGLGRLLGFNDSDLGSCANTPMPADCSSSTDLAWKYSYDGDGNQLSQTDPRNQSTFTTYDAVDRPLCRALTSTDATSCGGSTFATFFYDGYTNASTPGAAFPSGCVAPSGSYASDPVGEKTAELFVGTSGAGNGWRCYGYDQRGQADQSTLSVTTPDAGTVTQTMNITYNDGGEVTGLVYPDGETLTSTYDVNGRLHSIYFGTLTTADPVQFLLGQVSYTNAGQITSMAIGGSAAKTSVPTPVFSTTVTYDGIQRPLSTSAVVAGQTIWQQTRTYDNVGNVLGLNATLPTQGGGTATENESFCYDALNRLVWAGNSGTPTGGDHCMTAPIGTTLSTYSQSYSYDNLDRISSNTAGTYTYGDSTHYHATTGLSSMPNPYAAYDAMGNMTCRNLDTTTGHTCAGSTPTGATMSYDAYGQLTNWNAPSGTVGSAHYLYDNKGNRVLTNSVNASGTTDTVYFDGYTETVLSGGTTTTSKYYTANGTRIAMRVGATLSYLLSDPLGNNSIALNSVGQAIALQHYRPYGPMDYSWGSMPTSYNYTGQRLDSQTGLLYYGARYYDPVVGRFISADTVQGNPQGQDPYAYVQGNPMTLNDPSGHDDGNLEDGSGGSSFWLPDPSQLMNFNAGPATPVPPPPDMAGLTPGDGSNNSACPTGATDASCLGLTAAAQQHIQGSMTVKTTVKGMGGGVGVDCIGTLEGFCAIIPTTSGDFTTDTTININGTIVDPFSFCVGGYACDLLADMASGDDTQQGQKCSFTSETPVSTEQGQQAIGSLKEGEKVLAYNPVTKKMEYQPIKHVWINHDNDLVDLTLTTTKPAKDGKSGEHISEVIHTNQKHPFFTIEKGFLPVGKITVGMHVLRADGNIGEVTNWKAVLGIQTMYNLEVAQDHTFTVGEGQWIVHNCTGGDTTPGGLEYTDYSAARATQRKFTSEAIDNIVRNGRKTRTEEWLPDPNDPGILVKRWRYQDSRGNVIITNEHSDTIITVYGYHPGDNTEGDYIPPPPPKE